MDNYTLESFIEYCDDMMIVNEGLFSGIHSLIKRFCKTTKSVKKDQKNKKELPKINTKNSTEPKITYCNKAFFETRKYNGFDLYHEEYGSTAIDYAEISPAQLAKCKPVINKYLSIAKQFKQIVQNANNAAGGEYFEFINESLTKYEVMYSENDNSTCVIGYVIGYEFNNDVWTDKSLEIIVNSAWDKMDEAITELIKGNSDVKFIDCTLCKHNCDGFPEYSVKYHRFYDLVISN